MVNDYGRKALMCACYFGHHECAQALIDAGAAVDMVDIYGDTVLMRACDKGHHECTRALIDAHADLEMSKRDGQNALMTACTSPPSWHSQSVRQGRVKCALALLAATAPIREADSPDRAAVLKFAGERLQLIEAALASPYVIEDAPLLANVGVLKTDAQDVFAKFARDTLASAQPRRRSRRLAAKR